MDSLEFLQWFAPRGPWCLVAIKVDQKGLEAMTFHPGQEDRVRTWLDNVGRSHNVYFTVNPVSRDLATKPSRSDILEMSWLHVDVDPRPGKDLDDERRIILERLQAFHPRPSCVIDSGGGYQAFWRLAEARPIGGREALYEEAKRYNLQLELVLGGDSCHNVDRIMRLPGTVNRPGAKKREKGRREAMASVLWAEDTAHDIGVFTPAPLVQGVQAVSTVQVSGNVQRVEDLSSLPVDDIVRRVIAQGSDPDDPTRWSSRSEPLFWVCCELVRAGVDDDTIYAIITDPVWDISSSVVDKGSNVHSYALRQIERAREEAIDPMLREMNEKYAVVIVGGKTRVLTEKDDDSTHRSRVHYMSFGDFENYWRHRRVSWLGGKDGKTVIEEPAGKWWLRHEMRRTYEQVVFAPGRTVTGAYNLWKGFSCEARPGSGHESFLAHVRENVCNGDQETSDYVIRWMARCVQEPAQPGHVAIVLRGRQGTGKGVFANIFGNLWGRHFLVIRDCNHLFGQFNSHLRDCVLLFADEAFWAGDKKREGMLKSLVTEDKIMSERKGYDAELSSNFVHLIMASNESWVVPAGVDDRRFLVLDVDDRRMRDVDYFRGLNESMNSGGYENLLHYLMTMDLSEFDVRAVPQTEALRDQKMHSFSPEQEWWYTKLVAGRLDPLRGEWPERAWATQLCHEFTSYLKAWSAGLRSNETRLGLFLRKALPKLERVQVPGEHDVVQADGQVRTVERPYAYLLPSLEECRQHWDNHFGGPFHWDRGIEESPRVF